MTAQRLLDLQLEYATAKEMEATQGHGTGFTPDRPAHEVAAEYGEALRAFLTEE